SPSKAPYPGLLRRTLGRLLVERATYKVNSFQLTRSARLPGAPEHTHRPLPAPLSVLCVLCALCVAARQAWHWYDAADFVRRVESDHAQSQSLSCRIQPDA